MLKKINIIKIKIRCDLLITCKKGSEYSDPSIFLRKVDYLPTASLNLLPAVNTGTVFAGMLISFPV